MNKFYLQEIIKPYFFGSDRWYAWSMGIFLTSLSLSRVYCGLLFTKWNKGFFNALESKKFDQFIYQCWYFTVLAFIFILLYSTSKYLCQRYALRWRLWMTEHALKIWPYSPSRVLEGSDQRIQEDLMKFTDIFEGLILEMINNIVLITCFTPLLFKYTQEVKLFGLHIPGLLFYVIVLYSIVGLFISNFLGKPLINLEYDNQKYEAQLRYQLVHVRDGKKFEQKSFKSTIQSIIDNHIKLYQQQKYFNLWQKGYDQFSFLIPYLIVGPSYFSGILTLGSLMQIKSIFSRIRNSMAYLLDNYVLVMELLAVMKRLGEFYQSFNSKSLNLEKKI